MQGPFTPEYRLWLVQGILESFALTYTAEDLAGTNKSWTVGKHTRLMLNGAPDEPLFMLFYQDEPFAALKISEDLDITLHLNLTVREPGNFPSLTPLAEPLLFLNRILRAGRQLIQERAAG